MSNGSLSARATAGILNAAANCRCRSSSEHMCFVKDGCGFRRLALEHAEIGNVRIPLDQCGPRSAMRDRVAIERPDLRRYRGAMRVDQPWAGCIEPGDVNLDDRIGGHRSDVRARDR